LVRRGAGLSRQQYLADLNPNLGDWGTIFRDADDDACASQALSYFQAKINAQNAVSGRWTGWLKGGDVFLMSSAALRLGARGQLGSSLHGQIVTALSEYYDSTVGVGCSIGGGNGCMDEYTVAAAGYAWAGAYLWLTQSMAGSHNAGDFLVKAQDYVARSLSPLYSVCIHHIHPRPGAAASGDWSRRSQIYFEIMPTAASHVSTSCGHRVMGDSVGRSPNAWPPFTYKCISAGTPAFLSAE